VGFILRKKSNKKWLSIHPYEPSFTLCEDKVLRSISTLPSKQPFTISFLHNKEFIFTTLHISKNIPEEDIPSLLELQTYENLDLDPAVRYVIRYYEVPPFDPNKRTFHIFVTQDKNIFKVFGDLLKKNRYIDCILPAPLLFTPLYHQKLIEEGTHFFIYIEKDDAFVTLYTEGYLVYTKSIRFSFEDIAHKISQITGLSISALEVMEFLKEKGLILENDQDFSPYIEIFNEMLLEISDILIYLKRTYRVEIIDKIFFHSQIGFIKGIEEYIYTHLGKNPSAFDFDYGCVIENPDTNTLHILMHLVAKESKTYTYPNFTLFERPPPLFKRPSGQLLAALIVAILLASLYPLYTLVMAYKLKYEIALLKKEYLKIHTQRVLIESQLNSIKKRIHALQEKLQTKEKKLSKKQNILQAIYDKKVHYVLKAATLADLSKDLSNHKLFTTAVQAKEQNFTLHILADDEKKITSFIKDIYDHKSNRYELSTKEINQSTPNGFYTSTIKVIRK